MNSAGRVLFGEDSADGSGDEKHVFGTVRAEPVVHRGLIAQIQLVSRRGEDVPKPSAFSRRTIADPTRP